MTMVIDLEELLIRGDLTLNFPVNHGDVLNIPVSRKIFVGGEVVKPGGFLLKGKRMTINQAIAMAEGLKATADGTRSTIFRYSGRDGQRVHPGRYLCGPEGAGRGPFPERERYRHRSQERFENFPDLVQG